MSKNTLIDRLNENRLRKALINHEFFRRVKASPMSREQVAVFIGQWWHPLHYFPTFLARSVSVVPDIESKCAISTILNEEAGEGNPKRAHEVIYVDTMERVGFTKRQATESAPFRETKTLVDGYERASEERLGALGFIFATEVADLAMVSGIGAAVAKVAGTKDLEWVKIHVQQEPGHVNEAGHTMMCDFSPSEEALVMRSAEEMWGLWIAFFDRLEAETFPTAASIKGSEGVAAAAN